MKCFVVIALLCASCKGKDAKPPPPPKVADAAIAPVEATAPDWTAKCAEALAAKQTPVRKLALVIDSCRPCGDWKPLLDWNTPMVDGGPKEQTIFDTMVACKAYCSKDAKMQFEGTLPDAQSKSTDKPWRILGEKCGEAVSAVPDTRFMSAPYFALDRIAREGSNDSRLAPLLAALEVPLPPVSLNGNAFTLAEADVMKPELPKHHVTISASEIRIGTLATAKLGPNGITVDHGAAPYPGELVTTKDLRAKLDTLTGSPAGRVLVLAPNAIAASRVVEVVTAAGAHELVLGVAASGGPKGWALPGIIPVTLDVNAAKGTEWKLDAEVEPLIADLKTKQPSDFASPKISVGAKATVTGLAKLLGGLAFHGAKSVSLSKRP